MIIKKDGRVDIHISMPNEVPYVQVPNIMAGCTHLTGLAFKVLCYVKSREGIVQKDGTPWKLNTSDIIKHMKEGRDAVYKAIGLLEKEGHLHRYQPINENGKWAQAQYYYSWFRGNFSNLNNDEEPEPIEQDEPAPEQDSTPFPENPYTVNTDTESQGTYKERYKKTDNKKTESNKTQTRNPYPEVEKESSKQVEPKERERAIGFDANELHLPTKIKRVFKDWDDSKQQRTGVNPYDVETYYNQNKYRIYSVGEYYELEKVEQAKAIHENDFVSIVDWMVNDKMDKTTDTYKRLHGIVNKRIKDKSATAEREEHISLWLKRR